MQLFSFEILDWANPEIISLENYRDDGPIDFLLEVNLDYSNELHDYIMITL